MIQFNLDASTTARWYTGARNVIEYLQGIPADMLPEDDVYIQFPTGRIIKLHVELDGGPEFKELAKVINDGTPDSGRDEG